MNPITSLSPNEMRVMQLLTEGKWTKEIAAIMNVKENTVSTYKRRIFNKLDVVDSIELSKKVSLLKQFEAQPAGSIIHLRVVPALHTFALPIKIKFVAGEVQGILTGSAAFRYHPYSAPPCKLFEPRHLSTTELIKRARDTSALYTG